MPRRKDETKLKPRTRAYKPKVTTGCITCKIRRIKCDEEKPNCSRCTKSGRRCDGYVQSKIPTQNTTTLQVTFGKSPSANIIGTAKELHAYGFFRSQTVPQLCGLYGSTLWDRIILQSSHHEPAIRHAAIALGALHEQLISGDVPEQSKFQGSFAIQQYLKSISYLIPPNSTQSVDVALMTCAIFVCFDSLCGRVGSALSHIEGGVKIISELQLNDSSESSKSRLTVASSPYAPLATLNLIFFRLDEQVSQIAAGRGRHLTSHSLDNTDASYHQDMPACFSSFEEARNVLDYIWTASVRVFESIPEPEQELDGRLSQDLRASLDMIRSCSGLLLQEWAKAFEAFIRQSTQLDVTAQQAIHTLKIHYILTTILLSLHHNIAPADETAWDSYFVEFEAIISHAAAVVDLDRKRRRQAFSLDTEIILPLYLVASKCRQPNIRRKAVSILKSSSKQEGLLHGGITARVAQRIIDIEEGCLETVFSCEDIPNCARISDVEIRFDPEENRAFLRYLRWKSAKSTKRDTVDECLHW